MNPASLLAVLPAVSVYEDGTILTPGPVDAMYPGPLLAPVSVRHVGAEGLSQIRAAIHAAGLDGEGSVAPGVPGDQGVSVFTVIVDGQPVVTRLAGLSGPPGPGQPSADPHRAAAGDLLARLEDPSETFGAPAAPPTTYAPTAYQVYVAPGAPQADASTKQSPVAWPLSTPLATFGRPVVPDRGIAGLRAGVVSGNDARTLGPLLARATAITPFTSGGASYTLFARALLPDEAAGLGG